MVGEQDSADNEVSYTCSVSNLEALNESPTLRNTDQIHKTEVSAGQDQQFDSGQVESSCQILPVRKNSRHAGTKKLYIPASGCGIIL